MLPLKLSASDAGRGARWARNPQTRLYCQELLIVFVSHAYRTAVTLRHRPVGSRDGEGGLGEWTVQRRATPWLKCESGSRKGAMDTALWVVEGSSARGRVEPPPPALPQPGHNQSERLAKGRCSVTGQSFPVRCAPYTVLSSDQVTGLPSKKQCDIGRVRVASREPTKGL